MGEGLIAATAATERGLCRHWLAGAPTASCRSSSSPVGGDGSLLPAGHRQSRASTPTGARCCSPPLSSMSELDPVVGRSDERSRLAEVLRTIMPPGRTRMRRVAPRPVFWAVARSPANRGRRPDLWTFRPPTRTRGSPRDATLRSQERCQAERSGYEQIASGSNWNAGEFKLGISAVIASRLNMTSGAGCASAAAVMVPES